MKKKLIIISIIVVILILIVPIRTTFKDGGTKVYSAVLYKVIKWNRLLEADDSRRNETEIYYFPNNFHSIEWYDFVEPAPIQIFLGNARMSVLTGSYKYCNSGGRCEMVIKDFTGDFKDFPTMNVSGGSKITIPSLRNTYNAKVYKDVITNVIDTNYKFLNNNNEGLMFYAPEDKGKYLYEIKEINGDYNVEYYFIINVL